jgi:enoyl-CoA hydratase/carnithine racemase
LVTEQIVVSKISRNGVSRLGEGENTMDLEHTQYRTEKGVAVVTLHRPDHMNAFTPTMRDELVQLFSAADRDDAVRVVVVTGAGKAFCAGADLSSGESTFDFQKRVKKQLSADEWRDGAGQVSLAILRCRKPVIAAINGHAVGAGITITLPMDMRIAAEDAKIGFVFVRRGIVPEGCSTWLLPRIVGISKATELIFRGRAFRAIEEADSGLFTDVTAPADVLPRAMAIATEIVENTSAVSVALSKAMLWHGLSEATPQSAHRVESRCIFWAGQQKDAAEGVQSFLEKRPPRFSMSPGTDMPDFYPWGADDEDHG